MFIATATKSLNCKPIYACGCWAYGREMKLKSLVVVTLVHVGL